MIKRTINIIFVCVLLSAFFLNSFGYLIIYRQLKTSFKREAFKKIQEFIPFNKLERIAVSVKDISAGKISFRRIENFEIKLNGSMFDIYNEQTTCDSIVFYAIRDENENLLEIAFSKFIHDNNSDPKSRNSSNKLFKQLITEAITDSHDSSFHIYFNKLAFTTLKLNFLSAVIEVITPPPNIA